MRRIGHKGADLIEPGNTRASFDAALAHGVDMIELDVLPERSADAVGRLILAHDYEDAGERTPLTLENLKQQGIEPEKPPYTVREGGSRLCFVRDPDGYRVELIEKS